MTTNAPRSITEPPTILSGETGSQKIVSPIDMMSSVERIAQLEAELAFRNKQYDDLFALSTQDAIKFEVRQRELVALLENFTNMRTDARGFVSAFTLATIRANEALARVKGEQGGKEGT